jgi:hypothetical protein
LLQQYLGWEETSEADTLVPDTIQAGRGGDAAAMPATKRGINMGRATRETN